MRLDVIGTGSHGNAYVLTAGDDSLILDAGIHPKKVLPRCGRKLNGLLITHEHGDHAGFASAYLKYGIVPTMSPGTKKALELGVGTEVKAKEVFSLGRFTVRAFRTQHDAEDPLGFLIKYRPTGETVLYATDTYYLKYTFPDVDYWLIECNYCEELLGETNNSELRDRLIASHMSLRHLQEALKANDLRKTKKIVLIHLSDTRSDEEKMVSEIKKLTGTDTIAARNGMTIDLERTPF